MAVGQEVRQFKALSVTNKNLAYQYFDTQLTRKIFEMTFHDYNRLQAHLPEWLRERNLFLDLTTQLMAGDIAIKINANTGLYSVSADTLAQPDKDNPHSKRGTKKTWLTHMTTLEEVGLFRTKRLRQRQARFWELALPCPPSCVGEDFENHNSTQRRKQLEQQARVVDNSNQKSNLGDQKSKDYSTNREYIDIDDIEIQFSNLGLSEFITWAISQLPELNDQHNSLLGYLDTNKAEVESKALAILNKRNPALKGKYLYKVVTDTPAELFKQLITKTKAKATSKSVATIHTTETKPRVTFPRLKGFTSKQLGFEITEATTNYFVDKLRQGLEITHKDFVIAEQVERHNKQLRDEQLNTNSELELSCRQGLPKLYWTGENHNWNFYTQEFLEANGRPHYKEGYKLAEEHIEQLNADLVRLYELLPTNTNFEAYNFEAYLNNTYTLDDDLKELLEAYPLQPTQQGTNWDLTKAAEELLLALQRGLSFDELKARASQLPRNTASWANHKQHPHTWLREQYPTKPALASSDQTSPQQATNLSDLLSSLSKP